jgi:DNA polymerase-3 subunit epsilon
MPNLPPITFFDLETTGLDPRKGHRIIEIAGVRVENGQILKEKTFSSLVNPEREIPWEARQVNKISDEDVKTAPTIDAVLPQFLEFAQGSVLFAHNAAFDFGFLDAEKEYCWGYVELPECLCSMRLSQSLFPTEFRHSLDVLCKKYGLCMPAERHRALADTILASEALLKMIEAGKIQSFDDIRRRASLKQLVK